MHVDNVTLEWNLLAKINGFKNTLTNFKRAVAVISLVVVYFIYYQVNAKCQKYNLDKGVQLFDPLAEKRS